MADAVELPGIHFCRCYGITKQGCHFGFGKKRESVKRKNGGNLNLGLEVIQLGFSENQIGQLSTKSVRNTELIVKYKQVLSLFTPEQIMKILQDDNCDQQLKMVESYKDDLENGGFQANQIFNIICKKSRDEMDFSGRLSLFVKARNFKIAINVLIASICFGVMWKCSKGCNLSQ